MVEVRVTRGFVRWFEGLRDRRAQMRIQARIDKLALGKFGDVKSVGQGVSELRIDHGLGYRVYFVRRGEFVVILLCGGDKRTQSADIAAAQRMAKEDF